MHGKRRLAVLGLAALLLTFGLLLAACDGEEEKLTVTPTTAEEAELEEEGFVDVVLKEWSITEEETGTTTLTVEAGDVTFEAHNLGSIPHELEIFTIGQGVDMASLPVEAGKAKPEEVGAEEIDEIEEDLPPGSTAIATFHLEPGRYLLICNLPGHYQAGMFAELIVE